MTTSPLVVHGTALSGHTHRVLNFLGLLGLPHRLVDVSGYPYTARAPEGRISLDPYPHIRAWLARLEAVPGWIPMPVAPPQA